VIAVLVLDVAVVVTVAVFFTWWTAVVLGLTVGLCQSLGKLSLDALIQRDVAERVRTSMFARSETLLQLSWVIGGLIGIGLFTVDATPRIGLLVTAVILVAWLAFVLSRANGRKSGEDSRKPEEHGYGQQRGDRDTVTGQ
jgi:hypothetical protein